MSYPRLCLGCAFGEHDQHDAKGTTRPGLIGGEYCPCEGDCEAAPDPFVAAILAARTTTDPWTTGPMEREK